MNGYAIVGADTAPPVIDEYFARLNAADWAGFDALWHEDVELRPVGARPRTGRDDVVAFYPGIFRPWRTHVELPTRLIVAGDAVTAEIHFRGVSHDNHEIEFDAVDVFDIVDGRIARLTTWYDIAWVRQQLQGT